MLTLVFLASVSFATLQAKEGKKKKGVVEQKEAVQLLTPNDTLSYVAGMTATEGLLPYLQQQFGVDSTGMLTTRLSRLMRPECRLPRW